MEYQVKSLLRAKNNSYSFSGKGVIVLRAWNPVPEAILKANIGASSPRTIKNINTSTLIQLSATSILSNWWFWIISNAYDIVSIFGKQE
jgi:hypothetical protein